MQRTEAYCRFKKIEDETGVLLGVRAAGLGHKSCLPSLSWNAQVPFPSASVIKVPILFTCLRFVDLGRLRLDERVTLTAEEQVAGSGVLRDLAPGLQPTLRDLLTLMIIVSDNTATNMVIELIGTDAVNKDAARFGCTGTRLVGKLMLPPEKRDAAQRAGAISSTTATDMLRYMHMLYYGEGLSFAARDVAHQILYRQHYTDSLLRYLPWPPSLPTAPWNLAAKSGSIQGVRNQVGWLVSSTGNFAFAILSKGCTDQRYFSENAGNLAVGRAFRTPFDYFLGG